MTQHSGRRTLLLPSHFVQFCISARDATAADAVSSYPAQESRRRGGLARCGLRCGKRHRHHGSDMFGAVDAHRPSVQAGQAVNERKTEPRAFARDAGIVVDLLERAPEAFERGFGNPYSGVADNNLENVPVRSDVEKTGSE